MTKTDWCFLVVGTFSLCAFTYILYDINVSKTTKQITTPVTSNIKLIEHGEINGKHVDLIEVAGKKYIFTHDAICPASE